MDVTEITVEQFCEILKENDEDAKEILIRLIELGQKQLASDIWIGALETKSCKGVLIKWQSDKDMAAKIRSLYCDGTFNVFSGWKRNG